ncbi:MAG: HAMP domain-containing sensor histidine kinase [Myxococcota bacterium]
MVLALSRLLERVLPPPLRERMDETARRARNVVWLTAFLCPVHLLAASISTAIRGPNALAGILLLGGLGVGVTPALLYAFRSITPAAVWFLSVNLAAVSAVAWVGYGPLSPAAHTFVLFPVIGMVLGGSRLAVPFAGISVSQVAGLVLADKMGVQFPLEPSGPAYLATHTLVMSGVLIIVVGFLWSYEVAWRAASVRSELAQAAKNEFLAHMSHELRTPLNVVIGYTELLLEDAEPAEIGDLQRISGASRHLLSLVDGLLDLAKIESGKVDLRPEPVDFDALAGTLLDEVRPIAEQHGATLVREISGPLATRTDRLRVRQVLLNLLSNACKFAGGGTVTLRARGEGKALFVDVEDDGVGMQPHEVARVFEPFEQGEAGVGQGTGLGLAISRRLCEALGGSLTVESTPGVGTRFRMELPLTAP